MINQNAKSAQRLENMSIPIFRKTCAVHLIKIMAFPLAV